MPSYVKETRDFIQKLNQIEEVPEDNLLVTLDVYTIYYPYILHSIPNNKIIKAINKDHDKHSNNELNKKQKDKVEYETSSQNSPFLETYQKPTEQQSNLHAKSKHPNAFKKVLHTARP